MFNISDQIKRTYTLTRSYLNEMSIHKFTIENQKKTLDIIHDKLDSAIWFYVYWQVQRKIQNKVRETINVQ